MQEWGADGEGVQVAAEGEEWEEAGVVAKASHRQAGRAKALGPEIVFVLSVACRCRTNWGSPVLTQSAPNVGQE
ncbi:hypothetical protein MOMUL_28490 [Moorella mulderi DSM 14980]|uniref:Uncharacterized protein n=1 Tax=Moorella mulderi DSM 14980 TaxID=1122241 RepID=A0A151ATA2_9FIRM|nr:hypothetical protein MOMUL_28490 [Moorella mulderi DSM 14980]